MNKITITPDVILAATKYMPISEKHANAQAIASACVSHSEDGGMAKVDLRIKSILLLTNLISYYLNIDIDENTISEKAFDEYAFDEYASCRPIQQLERLKHNATCKAAVYDILSDYHEFKLMVEGEINALKEEYNDTVSRLKEALALFNSPDNLKRAVKELQDTAKEYTQALEKRGIIKGGGKDGES